MRHEVAPGVTGPELIARILALPPLMQIRLFRQMKAIEVRAIAQHWPLWAHDGQLPPDDENWRIWLIRAGRGFGKTRAGAEWVSEIARAIPGARIALVGGTADDVRAVMIEGESGILAVARDDEFVQFHRTAGEVEFQSGARAYVFSAEAPESLRGPQHHAAWCDEIAKWRYGEAAWDNLMFGLRLGDQTFELPGLDDTLLTAPRLMIAAAGTEPGWRRAALLYSLDDGARWMPIGSTAAPAVIGTLDAAPASGPATIMDKTTVIEVALAHDGMALAGADDLALDGGANLMLIGEELLQFGAAEQTGAARWRLSRLWRGRRGTEAAIGTQGAGDRIVLIEADTLATLDLPLSALGATARIMATGIGDTAGPASAATNISGQSVVPPSPVGARAVEAGGGDATVAWVRRSRLGWRWIDGADAPLGEEREAYHVTITPTGGPVRIVETSDSVAIVTAADRAGGPVAVAIRQAGSCGESPPAALTIGE